MYLIWKTDDTVVIAPVVAEQLTGLIRLVKGQRAGKTVWLHQCQIFGGFNSVLRGDAHGNGSDPERKLIHETHIRTWHWFEWAGCESRGVAGDIFWLQVWLFLCVSDHVMAFPTAGRLGRNVFSLSATANQSKFGGKLNSFFRNFKYFHTLFSGTQADSWHSRDMQKSRGQHLGNQSA